MANGAAFSAQRPRADVHRRDIPERREPALQPVCEVAPQLSLRFPNVSAVHYPADQFPRSPASLNAKRSHAGPRACECNRGAQPALAGAPLSEMEPTAKNAENTKN